MSTFKVNLHKNTIKINKNKKLTGNNGIITNGTSDNHDGIVQRTFRLFQELFRAAAQNQRTRCGIRATCENTSNYYKTEQTFS